MAASRCCTLRCIWLPALGLTIRLPGLLQLAAQLASESSACRTAVGREPGFIAALLRFVSDDVGHCARGAGGAETLAAAVGLLSQVLPCCTTLCCFAHCVQRVHIESRLLQVAMSWCS